MNAVETSVDSRSMLICRIGTRRCALPVGHVVETMRAMPILPLEEPLPFVRGLSVIRGDLLPVLDGWRLLGIQDESRMTALVVLRVGQRQMALAVDAVMGLRSVPEAVLHDLSPLVAGAVAEAVTAIGVLDAELLYVLQVSRMVPDNLWQRLDAL